MSKKMKNLRNLLIGTALVGGAFGLYVFMRKKFEKNSLRVRRLINKHTNVLNVYTYDYVSVAAPFVATKDVKKDLISSVYTNRAKKDGEYSRKFLLDGGAGKEYQQIVEFAKELNKVAPQATMVIHVVSASEVKKYASFKENLLNIISLEIDVKVDTEICDGIFEEKVV